MSVFNLNSFLFEYFRDLIFAIADVIISHPIYLLGIGIFVTGGVIGLGYRLIRG